MSVGRSVRLQPDPDRVVSELVTLGALSESPAPSVTRVVFTETDLRARAYLKQLCTDAGLPVREDAVGNTFARVTPALGFWLLAVALGLLLADSLTRHRARQRSWQRGSAAFIRVTDLLAACLSVCAA